jgi:non-lysosomal glucosylceramidase
VVFSISRPQIPAQAWSRAIGLGWDQPYTVRYPSNLDDGPWHGMPLGGFGAGCIGRSSRGDFNLWHLDGGEHEFQALPGCQFSVYESSGGTSCAYALATEAPEDGTLSEWNWYPASTPEHSTGTYSALYPRSWFEYKNVFKAELTCEQFTPIIPKNYQETSYPIAVFEWTAHNPTDEPIELSIMLTWENIARWFTNTIASPEITVRDDGSPYYDYKSRWGKSEGNRNRWVEDFSRLGCVLQGGEFGSEATEEGDGQWAIATVTNPIVKVTYHNRWNPVGDGDDLWASFATDGTLPNESSETPAAAGERIGAAIAVKFTLKPGKTRKIPFFLSWDLPITEFKPGIKAYRRYTDFFGRDGNNAWSVMRTALKHSDTWQAAIEAWQNPILQREDLPDWFKMALLNELYDLTAGGTLWTAADENNPKGQFAVLESLDYRWYESLDVRLYGSFALLQLWPELEKNVMLGFARAIPTSDDTPRVIGYNGAAAIRKAAGATPHDLGASNEHPWVQTNYTSYQDCNLWKDLPSDFVLLVYRDYLLTDGVNGQPDTDFLWDCWPAIVEALAYLKTFDQDNDGIPENSGAPDQTFDDWRLKGISAYCGGLWIAALEAAIAIAEILKTSTPPTLYPTEIDPNPTPVAYPDRDEAIATYRTWLTQARALYDTTLWNGEYYKLDSDSGSDVVMADQLCGQFYARLLGLPDVVTDDRAKSALNAVFDSCFTRYNATLSESIGAVNGVMRDGSPEDPNATHPLEVWAGINFGIAAFLMQMGLHDNAWQMTEAVVKQIYTGGLQFRTPEAITATGKFRAIFYLRACAIWAMYWMVRD